MSRFNSLKIRILVLTTVPLSAFLLLFLILTLRTADSAVDSSIRRSLRDAGSVFMKLLATRRSELLSMSLVTARDPRFFAIFSIPEEERGVEFGPTIEGVARDFLRITDADFLEVFDRDGGLLARVEKNRAVLSNSTPAGIAALEHALGGASGTDFYRQGDHLVVAAIVPVRVTHRLEAVLRLGSYCDESFVNEVRRLTGAEVCLTHGTHELTTTFLEPSNHHDEAQWPNLEAELPMAQESFALSDAFSVERAGKEHLAVQLRIEGSDGESFDAYLSREMGSELAPIVGVTEKMALVGAAAILVTFLAGYFVATRITRPISQVVRAAGELQSGNYDHPLEPSGPDEIAFLGRSFVAMRDSLREHMAHLHNVDQMKSNFIALAGHELKTPLTVITSFNEMIVSGDMGDVPQDVMETTQLIQEKLWEVNRLVENILDMSRAEEGLLELNRGNHDLKSIVGEMIRKRKAAIETRKLSVTTDVPEDACLACVDPERIAQAAMNLFDNALRFTPNNGRIHIGLRRENSHIVLSVSDTGVGIPPDEVRWIFEKAYEPGDLMHHSSGRFEYGTRGFGLGLALCKAIVDAHDGEIRVRSQVGKGSEFSIVLQAVQCTEGMSTPSFGPPEMHTTSSGSSSAEHVVATDRSKSMA